MSESCAGDSRVALVTHGGGPGGRASPPAVGPRAVGRPAVGRPAVGPRAVGRRAAAALIGCLALLAACSGPAPTAGQPDAPSAQHSASAEPPPPPAPTTSPFTGLPGGVGKQVLVVKLDNTPSAQPHRALARADIVYVEPVEGGLTRLGAVYSSKVPKAVGPVRSARISDVEVFAPFGNVAFVFSGAQQRLWPKLTAAAWTPVSPDLDSPGFHREIGRVAPFNMMAEPRRILATSGPVERSHDMGLVFDEQSPAGGTKARRVTARWDGSTMQFRWNGRAGAYDVWADGRQARDTEDPGVQRASTVVVQYVKQVDSGYGDKFGGRTPRTVAVGEGRGLVLRNGRAYRVRWQRASVEEPTTYLAADGQPMAFDPGQLWIVLMDRTRRVSEE